MKRVIFAIATVALLFATSCKKDQNAPENPILGEGEFLATIDNGANPQNAPAVKDGMGTMTTIDGNRYVIWDSGDSISINGSIYTANTSGSSVVFSGGNATGSTFTAFYPATLSNSVLPATQRFVPGKISNLPMYATCGSDRKLTFYNICAALKITIPAFVNGATSIVVSSNQRMNGTFSVTNNTAIVGTPSADADKKVAITKSSGSFATGEVVYIAVPAQIYSDFNVEFFNGETSMWDKTLAACTLAVNKVYNINVTPKPVDLGLSVKWAPFNVGAGSPEQYGDYYAWGEIEPYYETLSFGALSDDEEPFTGTWKTGKTAGYAEASYPYYDYNSCSEIGTPIFDATTFILEMSHDAARANWGGTWRMPTIEECAELLDDNNCTWTWTADYNSTGVAGYVVTSKKSGFVGNFIFLPAAGDLYTTSRCYAGTEGLYWSSTRYSNCKPPMWSNANSMFFTNEDHFTSGGDRSYGYTIRPVCY